jgi:hypothetical protein
VQLKLRELGLDAHDTSGEELYHVLVERVRRDNAKLEELLGNPSTSLHASVKRLVNSLDIPKEVFALKNASAKKLLRAHPPKKAMKALGYRSLESTLKREEPSLLFASAKFLESKAWHKSMQASYKKLGSKDFASQPVRLLAPASDKWAEASRGYVLRAKHNIISLRELGTVVLLPLPEPSVGGAALADLLLTLRAISDMRATSTYLKLHQVRPDFGQLVADIASHEPITSASLAGQSLPWRLVHQYFARNDNSYSADIFAPHVQPEDLSEHSLDATLASLHPSFAFWHGTDYLAHRDSSGRPVSLNSLDAVLNFCNHLSYDARIVQHFRVHLWHALLLGYLRGEQLAEHLRQQLTAELVAPEP